MCLTYSFNRKVNFLQLIVAGCLLISCDPGYAVKIENYSASSKNILVITPPTDTLTLKYKDSIHIIYQDSGYKIALQKDFNNHSYTFVLDKNKTAILNQGIGFPDLNQTLVINSNDTIHLKDKKRVNIKRSFMSTSIIIQIK